MQQVQHLVQHYEGQRGYAGVYFTLHGYGGIFSLRLQWLKVLAACPAAAGSTLLRHQPPPHPLLPCKL